MIPYIRLPVRSIPILIWFLVFGFWLIIYFMMGFSTKPPEGDEGDYLKRGLRFAEVGFQALSDGYRPPLLPIIIALLSKIFGADSILSMVRIFNIAVVSMIPAVWCYLYVFSQSEKKFLTMAILTGLWPAFFLFSYSAMAEAMSFFLLNILIVIALLIERRIAAYFYLMLVGALILSLMFYAKANNILVAIPFGLFLLFFGIQKFQARLIQVSGIALLTFTLTLPWVIFLHSQSGGLFLTTTGGINLLVGTGYHNFGMMPDHNAIHERYLRKSHLGNPPSLTEKQIQQLSSGEDKFKQDAVSKKIAIEIWLNDTSRTVIFSLYKVAHSLGLSLRGGIDLVVVGLLVITILISAIFLLKKRNADIVFFHWLMALMGAIVAFFWLPNIRFKTFYFDSTALLLIAFMAEELYISILRRKALKAIDPLPINRCTSKLE